MNFNDKLDSIFENVNKEPVGATDEGDEVLKGGLADNIDLDDIAKHHGVSKDKIYDEFEMGLKVEREHSNDMRKSIEITKDHLYEDPEYYSKLQKIED